MKLSSYIADLQAILDAEGDIDVVKTDPAYGAGAQGFGYRSADAPKIFRRGSYLGMQLIFSQGGRDIASSEPVVCVNAPMSFSWTGGGGGRAENSSCTTGGASGSGRFTYVSGVGFCGGGGASGGHAFSIPSDASEVYVSRRGGGLPPVEGTVKIERKE